MLAFQHQRRGGAGEGAADDHDIIIDFHRSEDDGLSALETQRALGGTGAVPAYACD
jgi:hypothetical protein